MREWHEGELYLLSLILGFQGEGRRTLIVTGVVHSVMSG
jgi:hypothetical protein